MRTIGAMVCTFSLCLLPTHTHPLSSYSLCYVCVSPSYTQTHTHVFPSLCSFLLHMRECGSGCVREREKERGKEKGKEKKVYVGRLDTDRLARFLASERDLYIGQVKCAHSCRKDRLSHSLLLSQYISPFVRPPHTHAHTHRDVHPIPHCSFLCVCVLVCV